MKTKKLLFFVLIVAVFLLALVVQYRLLTQPAQPPEAATPPPLSPETSLLNGTSIAPGEQAQEVISNTVAPTPANNSTTGFRPGTLLTNQNRDRIYYVTADDTARPIDSWMAFYTLGFRREAVFIIKDAELDQLPLSDHLTRHLYDERNYRYWAVNGLLWAIDDWQPLLIGPGYRGIPPTPADSFLLAGMPVIITIPDDILMRDGVKLYVKQGGDVYPVISSAVYQAFGYQFNQAIEIPPDAMAAYDHKPALTRFLQSRGIIYEIAEGQRRPTSMEAVIAAGYSEADVRTVSANFLRALPAADVSVSLHVTVPVVNLRQGPGTGYQVVEQSLAGEQLTLIGRTQDRSWFKVRHHGKTAWVAASVVEAKGDVASLPEIQAAIINAITPSPTPQPAPTQPMICSQLPVRGFGKVWADHLDVQHGLQCPTRREQGITTSVQQFQHGFMIWLEQDSLGGGDSVYAFFADSAYQRFNHIRPVDPAAVGTTPAGFYTVGDKFGAIYWEETGAGVKERLGLAITPQMESAAAFQPFGNGQMFWLGAIDRIFVAYTNPSNWNDFEDTFN